MAFSHIYIYIFTPEHIYSGGSTLFTSRGKKLYHQVPVSSYIYTYVVASRRTHALFGQGSCQRLGIDRTLLEPQLCFGDRLTLIPSNLPGTI